MSSFVWKSDTSTLYPGDPLRYSGKIIINPGEKDYIAAGYKKYEIPDTDKPESDEKGTEDKKSEINQMMSNIKSELADLEYLTSKELDGEDMSEYNLKYASEGGYKAHRVNLRKRYNQLEEELAKL